jgi:hypothetical protein
VLKNSFEFNHLLCFEVTKESRNELVVRGRLGVTRGCANHKLASLETENAGSKVEENFWG